MGEEKQALSASGACRLFEDDEESYARRLEQIRWPDGLECIRCSQTYVRRVTIPGRSGRVYPLYWCPTCRYQYRVTTGTMFHDSHIPLSKWFLAIQLICCAKRRSSIKWLQRELEVTYKTAWRMAHRIRLARRDDSGFYQRLFADIGQPPAKPSQEGLARDASSCEPSFG
jgi:transposase-like protein